MKANDLTAKSEDQTHARTEPLQWSAIKGPEGQAASMVVSRQAAQLFVSFAMPQAVVERGDQPTESGVSTPARTELLQWSDVSRQDPQKAIAPELVEQRLSELRRKIAAQSLQMKQAEDEMDKRQARERAELIAHLDATRPERARRLVEEAKQAWALQVLENCKPDPEKDTLN
jgi:hypothetical protein